MSGALMWKIVGTAECIFCKRAKHVLDSDGQAVEYETITKAEAKARGYATVPQIWHGERYVGGYRDLVKYYPSTR